MVHFQSIFESAAIGIEVLDIDGKVIQTNPAFRKMLGYSRRDIEGKHFIQFIPAPEAASATLLFNDLIQGSLTDFRREIRLYHKDGNTVWTSATFAGVLPGKDGRPDFVVAFAENISRRKEVENEMVEMKSRLHYNAEEERRRLARELHDGPVQELYGALFQIESLRSKLPEEDQEAWLNVKHDIQTAIRELRSMSHDLRPPTIGEFGLQKAILSHVKVFREKYPHLNIHLSLAEDRKLLPENIRLALFRIYQQSMTNIIRHARASEIDISFALDTNFVSLSVTDNGRGFEVPTSWMWLIRKGHFGLAGSAERVEALGGEFRVSSQVGRGTRLEVAIPIDNEGQST